MSAGQRRPGQAPKPVVLTILDGWGHRDAPDHNAIAAARTPTWDRLRTQYPHGLLDASGPAVGLPAGQMGNSEVGHMHIGAGRLIMQDLPRIDAAIDDRSLARNPELVGFISALKTSGGACHLMGLLSDGGVHAHQRHMAWLANHVAQAGVPVWVHAFLDGRDTPPRSAESYMRQFLTDTAAQPNVRIASLGGRYWAMDRDNRWERVETAYKALAHADASHMRDPLQAIAESYDAGTSDEFVKPVVVENYHGMKDGDGVLMANFRADRAREILSALLLPEFDKFSRRPIRFSTALGMVEYADFLNPHLRTLFPAQSTTRILGEEVSRAGLTQLRIAETEKYAHVTFFFNGGREAVFPGESRILVPSPKVATYDLQPEMSAPEVTDKLVDAIRSRQFDLIVVNYANTDMVGHTGDINAAVKAVEAVDACLGRVLDAVEQAGGAMLITADHGNAEMMEDHSTGQAHTAHTLNLVPAILAGPAFTGRAASLPTGTLTDIAPTVLELMGLPIPAEMSGQSLLQGLPGKVARA